MVPEEEDKTERYIWGLSDNIQGNMTSAGTVRLQDIIRMASSLMDQKNVARAYTIRANEKKAYARTMPYCNKCKLRHAGPCTVKCGNCKRIGHMTRDCKAPVAATNKRALVEIRRLLSLVLNVEADRSFVSTTFSSLIDIILTTLDVSYAIKQADGVKIKSKSTPRSGIGKSIKNQTRNPKLPKVGPPDKLIKGQDQRLGDKEKWMALLIALNISSTTNSTPQPLSKETQTKKTKTKDDPYPKSFL
ncbi:reverse transcriptase domain-containing protein [Tanacetum coccineum]